MYIKLFTTQGDIAVPTDSVYAISWLKDIIDNYPKNYIKIFSYLQFMYSWNPDDNPYLAMKEEDREETILSDIKADFSTEDDLIQVAMQNCQKLFELPAFRLWKSAKKGLDNIREYLDNNKVYSGKDGNNKDYRDTLKDLPNLEKAYNEGYKAFMEEAKLEVRGNRFNSQV
jgi:hypothetical protein